MRSDTSAATVLAQPDSAQSVPGTSPLAAATAAYVQAVPPDEGLLDFEIEELESRLAPTLNTPYGVTSGVGCIQSGA